MTSKEEKARREGMSYALRYAKEHGIEALEQDLKKRGAYNIPIRISDKDLQEFTYNTKNMILDTVLILASMTLRNEFDFGEKRLSRFIKRFNHEAECIGEDYTSWQNHIDILKEECGLEYRLRVNDKNIMI